VNILITSAGRRSYLVEYFKKALKGRGKVLVANSIANVPAALIAYKSYLVPYSWEIGYIDKLLTICREQEVKLLLSLHDIDVYILSKHRDVFTAEGINILVPSQQIAEACLDKLKLYEIVSKYGIRHCDTYVCLKEVRDMIDAGSLSYPLIIKPRWGFGSLGLFQVNSPEELLPLYNVLDITIKRTFLPKLECYEESKSIIIQPKLSGEEFGLNVVSDLNSKYTTCLVLRKNEMRSGETFSATTIYDKELTDMGKSISAMTHHKGVFDVDVMQQDGKYFLLEINPRFGGHYPFVHEAGADIPSAIIAWAEGRIPEEQWLSYQENFSIYKELKLCCKQETRY